jgi:sodium/potassium-transporting ATPase subunit alpha
MASRKVGIVTQEKVDGLNDMRASASALQFKGIPAAAIKPSEDTPVRALVLTGEEVESLESDDWDMLVGNYCSISTGCSVTRNAAQKNSPPKNP